MASYNITPLPVKFELRGYGEVHDVSNSIDNWRDVEITLKRDGTSGVFHELSFPFEFVLGAYDVVRGWFDKYQYRAVADIYIYIRRDDWIESVEKYHEPQIYNLDFTSYNETDTKIEIETRRVSLFDYLKAKRKVVYDIPVSEVKDNAQFLFDRIEMINNIALMSYFEVVEYDKVWNYSGLKSIGVSTETTEVGVPDVMYVNTTAMNISVSPTSNNNHSEYYFMYLSEKVDPRYVNVKMDIVGNALYVSLESSRVYVSLFRESGGTSYYIEKYTVAEAVGTVEKQIEFKTDRNIYMSPGDGLYFVVEFETTSTLMVSEFVINGKISVEYNAKNNPVNIDVISPKVLLQRLVENITETSGSYTSEIEEFNINNQDLIMLSAAESVRGIEPSDESEGAKVHTSYQSFVEWMNVFGYEEFIELNKITMRKRSNAFRGELTALELGVDECADLKRYVDDEYLFSGVKIGYQRKEIENANVRFEFNGQHDYSTDLPINENILELISPYRADCYGIEFLAQERLKETTDNKADKDIFILNVYYYSDGAIRPTWYYGSVNSLFTGNVLTNIGTGAINNTMFNGNINPFALLLRNLDLIGVSARSLKFTASDSNAEIVIDDVAINQSVDIPENAGLFDPIMYDIASGNMRQLPGGELMNGVVRFHYKGAIYEGFIDEISKNPAWESETTWKLRKRK